MENGHNGHDWSSGKLEMYSHTDLQTPAYSTLDDPVTFNLWLFNLRINACLSMHYMTTN